MDSVRTVEAIGMSYFTDFAVEIDLDVCGAAFFFEKGDDLLGAAVAEKLAQCFFVKGDAMFFHESDEVIGYVAG